MPKKIRLTIDLTISKRKTAKELVAVEQVFKDIVVKPDPFIDGFLITRKGKLGDVAAEFYLEEGGICLRIQSITWSKPRFGKVI